uniref:Tubulin/FtsZ GTPase domain-containing protein n=1 Tax=Sparus aurata TaxID=8175 RepID=A0A671YXF4_SPAAU
MREIVHLQAGQCGNQIGAKEGSTCRGPSWWILSQAPWTLSAPAPSDRSSDLTTLSSARVEPVTTGQRATTQKELSWWTRSWMW